MIRLLLQSSLSARAVAFSSRPDREAAAARKLPAQIWTALRPLRSRRASAPRVAPLHLDSRRQRGRSGDRVEAGRETEGARSGVFLRAHHDDDHRISPSPPRKPARGWKCCIARSISGRSCAAPIAVIRPVRVVLVEAEVWPNLAAEARGRGIPLALVNARLSQRSERRFRRFSFLVAPTFRCLDLVCVQEPEDIERWVALGVPRRADSSRRQHQIRSGGERG